MTGDSRTLLLAFGGMVGRIGIPPFEFFSLTGEMPVKRLFVRDLRQAWYHRGIPGHGASLPEVADSLRAMIARRTSTVSSSPAPRRAATRRSCSAPCSAPTPCSASRRRPCSTSTSWPRMDDHRWDDRLGRQSAGGDVDTRFTDLRRVLPRARRADTRYRIYFADALTPTGCTPSAWPGWRACGCTASATQPQHRPLTS